MDDRIKPLKDLIRYSEQIEELFTYLYTIELSEGRDSNNFKDLYSKLESLIEDETIIYESIDSITMSLMFATLETMMGDDPLATMTNDTSTTMNRVRINVQKIMMGENGRGFKSLRKIIDPNKLEYLNDLRVNETSFAIYYDVIAVIANVLQDRIDEKDDNRSTLLNLQYKLAFMFNDLSLINIQSKDVYLTSKCSSNIYGLSQESYKELKTIMYMNMCKTAIEELINKKGSTSDKLYQEVLIESCLLLLDNKAITDINAEFHMLVDDLEDKEREEENVISCFTKIKETKKAHPIVSISLEA